MTIEGSRLETVFWAILHSFPLGEEPLGSQREKTKKKNRSLARGMGLAGTVAPAPLHRREKVLGKSDIVLFLRRRGAMKKFLR